MMPKSTSELSDADSDIFIVERIEKSRTLYGGEVEYFIKWQGYPSSENSWEPEANIVDRSIIKDFHKSQSRKQKHSEEKLRAEEEASRKRKLERKNNLQKLADLKKQRHEEKVEQKQEDPMDTLKKVMEMEQRKNKKFPHRTLMAMTQLPATITSSAPTYPVTALPNNEENMEHTNTIIANPEMKKKFFERLIKGAAAPAQPTTLVKTWDRMESVPNSNDMVPSALAETGFERGYQVDTVIGMLLDKEGGPAFLVKWKDVHEGDEPILEVIPRQVLNMKEPQKVIRYYESIVRFDKYEDTDSD